MEPRTAAPPTGDIVAGAVGDAVADEPVVVVAWVFGSVARGTAGPLSDIDVALVLGRPADSEGVCDRVFAALARQLKTDRIDLVVFHEASLTLQARIVREGRLVVCRDRVRYEQLTTDAVMRDLDFQPAREAALRAVASAIMEGD